MTGVAARKVDDLVAVSASWRTMGMAFEADDIVVQAVIMDLG